MTVESGQIVVFYIFGIISFVFGIEEEDSPKDYLYLGLSFFINTIGYYISYSEAAYVDTAYLPLLLLAISIIIMIYKGFIYIQKSLKDDYSNGDDD